MCDNKGCDSKGYDNKRSVIARGGKTRGVLTYEKLRSETKKKIPFKRESG